MIPALNRIQTNPKTQLPSEWQGREKTEKLRKTRDTPLRLDMVSGLRRDANQVFAPGFEPEYETRNWKLLAHKDDDGFFWECDGERFTTEQVIEAGLEALVENVTR